ncbi:hypothetical protein NUSPORA_01361 [Nucleospora cyclopteri]
MPKNNNFQHFLLVSFHIIALFVGIFFKCRFKATNLTFFSIAFHLSHNKMLNLLGTTLICNCIFFINSIISDFAFGVLYETERARYNERALEFITSCAMTAVSFPYCLKVENLGAFAVFYAFRGLSWTFQLNTERNRRSSMNYYAIGFCLIIIFILRGLVNKFALVFMSFKGLLAFEYCLTLFYFVKFILLNYFSYDGTPTLLFGIQFFYILSRIVVVGYYANNLSKFRVPITYIKMLAIDFYKLKKKIVVFYNYIMLCRELEVFPDMECNEMCAICTDTIEKGKKLGCNHVFHTECLKMWCERESTCPVCRKPLTFNKEIVIETENEVISVLPM